MSYAFQRRRGSTANHSAFTGLAGELTIDTTKNVVVVHDGSTAGGIPQVATTDTRLTDARAPSGSAGGDLTGSYPNPTLNTVAIGKGGTGQTTAVAAGDALHVKGADIVSAGTTDLSTATGDFVFITGTTTITAFGTCAAGVERTLKFAGALTLTHNGTTLILPGAANITTAATDTAVMRSLGSGNWLCVEYSRAAAPPVSGTNTGDQTNIAGNAATVTTNANLTGPITSVGNATTVADAELAALAGLTSAADALPYFTGSGTAAVTTFSAAARTVIDDASVGAMLDTLGGASHTGTGGIVCANTPTLTSPVIAAGSASANSWPKLTSGTVLTTPEAGALEYDGSCFYGDPSAGNRGVVPALSFIRLTSANTLANSGSAQAIFSNIGTGTLTLPGGTYFFECLLSLSSMSATSGNAKIDFLGAGGATTTKWLWNAQGYDATPGAGNNAVNGHVFGASASGTSIVTVATGTGMDVYCSGSFDVTGGGTLIPSITLVTAIGTVSVAIGSYFRCYCVGPAATQKVGQWS